MAGGPSLCFHFPDRRLTLRDMESLPRGAVDRVNAIKLFNFLFPPFSHHSTSFWISLIHRARTHLGNTDL